MSYTLPPIADGKRIEYAHFPDKLCAFVFRNWEMLEASTLAYTIGATEADINQLASAMGLPMPNSPDADWRKYGYITIIRANWHLLSYKQLCNLLGWDEEKLAFTLKEDDFLDVKLGGFKPDVPDLLWHEFDRSALVAVKKAASEFFSKTPASELPPFAFNHMFERVQRTLSTNIADPPRFKNRIAYSYCALYGDTFTADTDYSFPESLLSAYESVGVNGIWCQAVLYTLAPFPFEPEMSKGWEARLSGMKTLTERMARHGIKLFLYLNEPRSMPILFFKKNPDLMGDSNVTTACLCTSAPEVQSYIYDSVALIVKKVPLLGGFFTITASENQTNCYSHHGDRASNCPRCKNRSKAEVLAEVNTLIYRGAASVNPDICMIAWTWGWEGSIIPDVIKNMPPKIAVMNVSEQAVQKNIGGVTTSVIDYSISVVGPGDYAKAAWKSARARNHPTYAKCQFNNTWECSFVPFLPAFGQVYRHMKGLCEEGVDGLLLDWTLGGYPSPTISMLSPMFGEGEIPSLRQLYERVFPADSIDAVERAGNLFSEAFDCFPFDISVAYVAPQNTGTGNLFYISPTGFKATMVGLPYDDLDGWRSIFPVEVFEEQFKKLSEIWEKGLKELPSGNSNTLRLLIDCAEAAYCHFRSTYLQIRFVRIRDGQSEGSLSEIAEEEAALCLRLATVQSRNPCIGYESTNHYFYNKYTLAEKYVNCKYIIKR
jgi:hypothetical protein